MKTILVPIDFSDVSENAANYAAEMAKLWKARVILLHPFSLVGPLTESPASDLQFEEVSRINEKFLRIFDTKLKATYGNIETELRTTVGFYVEEILSLAEGENVDLIVMGIAGTGKALSIMDSHAIAVIKQTKRTVLIIPENAKYQKPEKIALACDYSAKPSDTVINVFKDFARLFDARVLIFDVLKKSEVITREKAVVEESLVESINDMDYSLYYPSGDNVVDEINHFIHSNKVDMLCMIPHKHKFLSGLFHNSSTKQVTLKTDIPLLAIHEV